MMNWKVCGRKREWSVSVHLHDWTEKKYEKEKSGCSVSRPKFKAEEKLETLSPEINCLVINKQTK
jgi:hypothetical protein